MIISKNAVCNIRELLNALAEHDYAKIKRNNWFGRTVPEDIQRVISEYGCTLTPPPDNFFDLADYTSYSDGKGGLIELPLWTKEEGRSDLEVSIEYDAISGEIFGINDLRVP
jgi:hypothetical protein